MRLSLPYPADPLWPNKRPHWSAKAREAKKAKEYAYWLAKEAGGVSFGNGPMPVRITVYPKRFGPRPDRDNVVASAKAFLDGIAQAIGMNDRHFAAPIVDFAEARDCRFVIEVGHG
jgi:crossover junction endodeoxyribonuclease RusA